MSLPGGSELLDALVNGTLLGGLFAITALGLSLVFGVMRLINLVHGELLVLGAYVAYVVGRELGLDPLLSLLVVVPVAFVVALPVQRWLLQPLMDKGAEPALLTTFGLSVVAQNGFVLLFSGDTQTLPAGYATSSLQLLGIAVPVVYLISFGLALVLCGGVHWTLQKTQLGRAVRASSEKPAAAAVLGVDIGRINLLVFGVAAACAAVGGVLVGVTFQFQPTTGTSWLLTGFVVVVLGGLGSVKGTLVGGIVLGVVQALGGAVWGDGYRDLVGFVVFLLVLTVRPQGLFGRERFA